MVWISVISLMLYVEYMFENLIFVGQRWTQHIEYSYLYICNNIHDVCTRSPRTSVIRVTSCNIIHVLIKENKSCSVQKFVLNDYILNSLGKTIQHLSSYYNDKCHDILIVNLKIVLHETKRHMEYHTSIINWSHSVLWWNWLKSRCSVVLSLVW